MRRYLHYGILGVLSLGIAFYQIEYNRKKSHRQKKKQEKIEIQNRVISSMKKTSYSYYFFPAQLREVPKLDGDIILDVKNIQIRNVFAPFNGSIIEKGEGYLLFFRYDLVQQMHERKFNSYLGMVELDKHFHQNEKEFISMDTKSGSAQDPRIIEKNGEFFLIYNDQFEKDPHYRTIHVANLDTGQKQVRTLKGMDLRLQKFDKNWVPFVYGSDLYFEYQISHPRKIFKLDTSGEEIRNVYLPEGLTKEVEFWKEKWGSPRGGTPARLVDGEYLGFFHSNFIDKKGEIWYVMGAYTFEPNPPFRLTKISHEPILFRGIYESSRLNTAELDRYVIFPCGFAIEDREGKILLHLSCGENDSALKILTFDKEKLLQSLKRL